ncbi:MAG TPA: twin-arginine translocase TatA/TatE family subunit [Polyangiaceae bacterium]|nr:twin-arginine translocase TatA/TatE family subunit [Polyangiaceae bacterium]
MLGVSFSEIVMIAIVALIVVGPRRLPEILGQLGRWVGKIRRMTTEVRRQTGIDEILREEGISGGINELRSMMRGELSNLQRYASGTSTLVQEPPRNDAVVDAYGESIAYDKLREQPIEGVDAYGAIPEDLLAAAAPVPPTATAPVPPTATAPSTSLVSPRGEPPPALERAADANAAAPAAKGSA